MKNNKTIILSLYPNARGLGYACLEKPQKVKESGVITIRPICNRKVLERVSKFVDFFRPHVVIVKDYEATSWKQKRSAALAESIASFAKENNIPVYRYSRQQIREVFEQFGATSKYTIAQKIISWFPHFQRHAPKIRKPWMAEDYHMGEFDAVSLTLTHLYLTE